MAEIWLLVCGFGRRAVPGQFWQAEPLSTDREGGATFGGMRRTAEILTTIVLFAIVMTVIGWGVNAAVPSVHAWLIEHLGQAGFWAGFIIVWLAAGAYAWHGHRPNAGKAGKAVGR